MNFYKHHIGDYDSATAHLSWGEDMAYTRMLRLYYRREGPLPADFKQLCRLIRAGKKEEPFVQAVLEEFFILDDDGWHNARADEEIVIAQDRAEKNRAVGKRGGRPRKTETQNDPDDGENGNPKITQMVSENNPDGLQTETQMVSENNPPARGTNSHKPLATSQKPDLPTYLPASQARAREGAAPIADDWEPTAAFWALATRSGHAKESPDFPDALTDFLAYWRTRPGESRTQSEWEKAFLENWRRFRSHVSSPSTRPQKPRPLSPHSDFEQRDYSAGINPDGSF